MSQNPYGPPSPEEPDRPYSGRPYSGQPPPYGQQRPNAQPPPYGQPSYGQQPQYGSSYGQQPGNGQEPAYGQQSPYDQQPSYGQQSPYGQPDPTSAQPVYGSPYGEPGSPAGAYPAPTPPKKSKALPIVLITLAVILLLCFGGGAFLYANRDKVQKLADTAASSAPTASPGGKATSDGATAPTVTYKVVEPKTLNGRPKLNDKQFKSLNDEMKKGVSDIPDATSSVGALYGSVERRNIVMIAAVAAPVSDPKGEVDGAFAGAGLGGTKVTGIVDVDPGPLGGEAKCGKAVEDNLTMAVCTWADDGSMGMVFFFFKSVSSAKVELPKIRGQIEKKSS